MLFLLGLIPYLAAITTLVYILKFDRKIGPTLLPIYAIVLFAVHISLPIIMIPLEIGLVVYILREHKI